MAYRRRLQQRHQPPLPHDRSSSFAVREDGGGAAVGATASPQALDGEDSSVTELQGKLDDVCRDVEEIKDKFADLEVIRRTVSTIHDTVKSEMNKMMEESAAVNKRLMAKVEKIHDFLTGEIDTGRDERPRSSKFEWQVKNFSKIKDQMLKGKAKSFFSDNFYVGIQGYRMYLGAHFSEKNEKGKDSLSVYAYITKGPYDRTLQWPYARRSTFVIVDQKYNMHHKTVEFVPEELGSKQEHCFQRPTNGPNEGYGFTAMMPLEELEDPRKGYLMNDSFLVHFITHVI